MTAAGLLAALLLGLACSRQHAAGASDATDAAQRLRGPRVRASGPAGRTGRQLHAAAAREPDYYDQLVSAPSKLARQTKKEGVLPQSKYSLESFDVLPFQTWLREHTMLSLAAGNAANASATAAAAAAATSGTEAAAAALRAAPPLSYICGVWINPTYKFIFIRNRKTASSTFVTAIKKFMLANNLCNVSSDPLGGNTCMVRMEPEELLRRGHDPDGLWASHLVLTSSRNPWARAASGYEFTYSKWHHKGGGCAQPSFLQFSRDPFIMGKLSNLFSCVGHREGVGSRYEGHWNFDFCHVEPAARCLVDEAGRLVVDFVIRYERLEEDIQAAVQLINQRRPEGLPAITVGEVAWRNKGSAAAASELSSTSAAATVYAPKYRACGPPCAAALADFYAADLALFGWARPGGEGE
ncbi:hypothetical protein HXX76_013178 [Chlamydomonas incerta]|uniref:Sulfotransferase n=1 Tax=Chlamydomonas incerta TaxID=51695 RepID=A0A835SJP7_CHLIN|nr:hypothetical protein HXX76_013178 [Chlamydomonas incerta]|eukprot:KAG2426197.1 hypothetical protein HXX76_013178 [Chlamydomonas incerta]